MELLKVTLRDLEWAAGFLEGEGSFLCGKTKSQIQVTAAQVQRWPLEKIQNMFGGGISLNEETRKNRQPCHHWHTTDARAAGICMTLYPLMSPRRQKQIVAALDRWKAKPFRRGENARTCLNGHPWSEESTYLWNGKRLCRTCRSYQEQVRKGWRVPRWENRHPGETENFQCKRGHAYVEENIYWWRGKRYCRACKKEQQAAWRQANKTNIVAQELIG